jgi:DNA-directed RNA polymerase specialized sigma24 family protein
MSHLVSQDPQDISSRYSNEDRLGYDGDYDIESIIDMELAPEPQEEIEISGSSVDFSIMEKYLPRIPSREADLIRLYFRDELKQEQIAKVFKITQAAVSYRLHRGKKRIQFLRTIPELEKEEFDKDLTGRFSEQDLNILWLMYETTCQSAIAKKLGLTQGRVRHRFFRALDKIKSLIDDECRIAEKKIKETVSDNEIISRKLAQVAKDSVFAKYYTVYFAISDKHFNILWEVSLPQFKNRGDDEVLSI